MTIAFTSVDVIITVNIVNRNSGNELIILRVWLDPLPHLTRPLFSFAGEGHSALDYSRSCSCELAGARGAIQ